MRKRWVHFPLVNQRWNNTSPLWKRKNDIDLFYIVIPSERHRLISLTCRISIIAKKVAVVVKTASLEIGKRIFLFVWLWNQRAMQERERVYNKKKTRDGEKSFFRSACVPLLAIAVRVYLSQQQLLFSFTSTYVWRSEIFFFFFFPSSSSFSSSPSRDGASLPLGFFFLFKKTKGRRRRKEN